MTVLWVGLATGAVYALVALGFNMTLTLAGVLNFAVPHIMMIGGFVAVGATAAGMPVVAILALAAVAGAVIGAVEERVAIRPLRLKGGEGNELVTTVGFGIVLTGFAILVWTSDPRAVPIFTEHSFRLPGGSWSLVDVILIVTAVTLGIGFHLWTRRGVTGLASLARVEDAEAAMLRGVNVRTFSFLGIVATAALAGLLGPLIAAKTFASVALPLVLAIKAFVALTLGGIGHNVGVVVGGFIVGLIEAGAQFWLGGVWGNAAVFVTFVAVLLIRPEGLFGDRELRTV
jgi:branched-chain amino acid transport system permease protein